MYQNDVVGISWCSQGSNFYVTFRKTKNGFQTHDMLLGPKGQMCELEGYSNG